PTHPYQVLDRVALELGGCPPHEIPDAPERAAARAFGYDGGRRLLAPIPDEPEPYPNGSRIPDPGSRFPFYRAPHVTQIHIRQPGLDSVPLGVPPQRVERIESHRLIVEERAV